MPPMNLVWIRLNKILIYLPRQTSHSFVSWGADLCWALGEIICNFTPILPSSTWGDEPRPRFCSGEQIKWRPKKEVLTKYGTLFSQIQVKTKKKVFTKNGTLFFPEFNGHLRSDAHQSQITGGGCRCRPYSSYWGDTVKLLGRYVPPSSPNFGTPVCQQKNFANSCLLRCHKLVRSQTD